MQLGWVVLCGVVTAGCGNELAKVDYAGAFVGDWVCSSGQREIDCGQGIRTADLALGPPDVIRFERGTVTDLALQLPSRVVVPGLPGGPSCSLAFDAWSDIASLQAESACSDDHGQRVVVAQCSANNSWRADTVYLDTEATTVDGCRVKTAANCYAQQ
jgi:hypothetical protein